MQIFGPAINHLSERCKYFDSYDKIEYIYGVDEKYNWGIGADCLELNAAETKINYTGNYQESNLHPNSSTQFSVYIYKCLIYLS